MERTQKVIDKTIEKRNGNAPFAVINFYNRDKTTLVDSLGNRTRGVMVRVEDRLLYGLTKLHNRRSYYRVEFKNLTEEMREKIFQHFNNNNF